MGEAANYRTGRNDVTESGYTARMRRNVLGIEREIRQNDKEHLVAFDAKGNRLFRVTQDNEGSVYVDGEQEELMNGAVVTHNHPSALKANGVRRIGNSFSGGDIASSIGLNVREIRAVTPTYTFSLKRPKGGWGVSAKQAAAEYNKIMFSTMSKDYDYVKGGKSRAEKESRNDRAMIRLQHSVVRTLAKKYGWEYTKKNR